MTCRAVQGGRGEAQDVPSAERFARSCGDGDRGEAGRVAITTSFSGTVPGDVRTAALIADVFVSQGNKASMTNAKTIIEGTVHSLARNTAESDIALTGQLVGALAASATFGSGSMVTIDNCAVYSPSDLPDIGVKAEAIAASVDRGQAVCDAYLLNCDIAEVEATAKAFRFTSKDLERLLKGEKLKTLNDLEVNGKVTIFGAADLNGSWRENTPDAKFFKAELSL